MEHLRKCVVCGELKDRKDMIKITKESASGKLVVQPNTKTFGRSAYLCYNQVCTENALKGVNRALKIKLSKDELKGLLDGQFKS